MFTLSFFSLDVHILFFWGGVKERGFGGVVFMFFVFMFFLVEGVVVVVWLRELSVHEEGEGEGEGEVRRGR